MGRLFIDPLANSNVDILLGPGPGSVFCFDTKVGEVFSDGLTDERSLLRRGPWVHQNVRSLIDSDDCPCRLPSASAKLGLRLRPAWR